MEEPS